MPNHSVHVSNTHSIVLGDNVSTEIKIISMLLKRYINYDDNYMKGVHEKNTFSGRSRFLLLVSTLPAMENASSFSHSSPVISYQYQKHPEIIACPFYSHFSMAFFGATSLGSSGWLVWR